MKTYRKYFPILKNITYLDSAALVQKPKSVIDAGVEFYTKFAVNSHSRNSKLGLINEEKIEIVRQKTAKLINSQTEEITFTSGTTESINLFVLMYKNFIKKNDEILLSSYNHTSNLIPWFNLAKEKKAKIVLSENIEKDINPKTKIISFSQKTNNINVEINIKKIKKLALKNKAIVVNDATQAINSQEVDFDDFDVVAFSSNKTYGPTGLGVLAIKKKLLNKLKPIKTGGGTVSTIVDETNWTYYENVNKFEAGTLNLAAIWEFEKSLDLIEEVGIKKINLQLKKISNYLYDELSKIKDIKIYGQRGDSILLFNIKNVPAQDISSYLGHNNIFVRSGTFCAPLISNILKEDSFVRVSLAFYNNKKDIDVLIKYLKNYEGFLDFV
ncbi:aminotransferase class V-fold PLP-dependent enzyme [Mycoplasma sp. 1654_15]|uniref:aminotransferase class V-fold PLP-dependent enzyme n=1 Tax=Mycoplasma sp. 1654_15 TaxID=2725994 RepID=UPI001448ED1C|nr:aminotransferase class V-fold PLP-dependent enzyme [Mycoplasma sp. 1654_15]QJB71290.1 aminotransferase class V-fold PLP-dependent enzyme [Mycoplasma sp. 1654_15]